MAISFPGRYVGLWLLWSINAALALASGIAGIAGFAAVLWGVRAVGSVGALVFAMVGISAPLFAYAGLAGVLLLLGALTLVGITNTFCWSYSTLAYLHLSGRGVPMETVA